MNVINDIGIDMKFCNICDQQKEKLIRIKTIVPNKVSQDLTINYELHVSMCEDCLQLGIDHINKDTKKFKKIMCLDSRDTEGVGDYLSGMPVSKKYKITIEEI